MSKSNTAKTTGDLIQQKIKSKGMTKRAVSEKSGIPYSSLNSKLQGYRSFTLDDIATIAEAIGEPPSALCPPEFTNPKPVATALADSKEKKS